MIKTPNVIDVRSYFKYQLANKEFTIDKTGAKTIEWIGASFIADEPAIFGTPNEEYINKEIAWYESESTNINDIYGSDREPPSAWQYAANDHGEINSNYGHLIWSNKYSNQFNKVFNELLENPDGRRATMVYNRPSIWNEYNENGKSDFICTNAVSYYIRDNQLHSVVQMRSNDVVFGYKNDYAWQSYVADLMCNRLNTSVERAFMPLLTVGQIVWQVQNIHCYERHFHLVDPNWDK